MLIIEGFILPSLCLICNESPKRSGSGQRFCSDECAEVAKSRRAKPDPQRMRVSRARYRRRLGQAERPPTWDEDGNRRCPWGEHYVPLSEFKSGYCDTCRPEQRRDSTLRNKYGITLETYREMWSAQGGCCAICGESPERLDVDHCHETGRVRGLLCIRCNYSLLGAVKDDIEILRKAVIYLEH